MSIGTTNGNAAKETGGNLDAQTTLLKSLEEQKYLSQRILAALHALGAQLASVTGTSFEPDMFDK